MLRWRAIFKTGDEHIIAAAGDNVAVLPDTPHCFANAGDDVLEMMDIHAAERFTTVWLED